MYYVLDHCANISIKTKQKQAIKCADDKSNLTPHVTHAGEWMRINNIIANHGASDILQSRVWPVTNISYLNI
jgi:hypothetical protein